MTPAAAWENDAFRTYVLIVGGLLLLAGLALAILTWGLRRNVTSIWATYRSWLIMIPLIFAAIFAGRVAMVLFVFAVGAVGFTEFARATKLTQDRWLMFTAYAAIVASCIVTLMTDPRQDRPGWYGMFIALPVYAIATILIVPILRNRTKGQLQAVSLAIVGFIYLGWMFGHLGFLANSKHAYGYLLYLFFAVELNDIAAFTCGKLFGRRKLRSEISPNKTWGGAIGAVCVSLALPWLLRFSFPHFGALQLVLTGLIVGIGGQLGDLSISYIKRDLGIKDMGTIIPGHGGVLDRIDSLIYVAPLFFHMARWFYDI